MSHSTREFKNGLRFHQHHLSAFKRISDVHEPKQEAIFRSLIAVIPADGCFVNIGASIGFYPLLAKRWSPLLRVHAYEPLDRHRDYFLENVALNGFQPSDFALYKEGVSWEDGHIDYHENGYGSTIISKRSVTMKQRLKQVRLKLRRWLIRKGIRNYPLKFTRIPVVSLDTVLHRSEGAIDLLQMDVQGSEGDILGGGRALLESGSIKTHLISTHGAPMHTRCKRILERSGYRILHDDRQVKHDGLLVARHHTCEPISVAMSPLRT